MSNLIKIEKEIVGWRIGGQTQRDSSAITDCHAPKRPLELECDIHKATVRGEGWVLLVGLLNGRPYEVMGGLSEYIDIPAKYSTGILHKRPRKSVNSRYDLSFGEGEDMIMVKNIVKIFDNPNYGTLTRMISMGLRHGVPVNYIVEQLQRDEHSDMFSFSRVIARVLKKYILDGTTASISAGGKCSCGPDDTPNFVYQSGCLTCLSCGHSKCG